MTDWNTKIDSVQTFLKHENLDGWLIYDFRRSNDLGCGFLEIPASTLLTRRFFYFIPNQGVPVKVVHRIENTALDHLPGTVLEYSSWKELEACVSKVLEKVNGVAMEYSPNNAIPTISKVDAGTIEMVHSFGVEIESSADLLQNYTCVWTEEQYQMHMEAANVLQETVVRAWKMIADALKGGVAGHGVRCSAVYSGRVQKERLHQRSSPYLRRQCPFCQSPLCS